MSGGTNGEAPHADGAATLGWGEDSVRTQRRAVRDMFDRVSSRYDLLNRLLSLGLDGSWRTRTVREMRLQSDDRVLDVACGTGDLALEAAGAVPRGEVVGIDFASAMLAIGREKAVRAAGPAPIRFTNAAAEALPFRDGIFAACGVAFGIRNVPDRAGAIGEMSRVVRPGGRVVILELTGARRNPIDRLVGFYVRHIMPRLGALLSRGEAYDYLASSMESFPDPDQFADAMKQAGLEEVRANRVFPGPAWIFSGTVPVGKGGSR